MNDDALAAVFAAANLLIARRQPAPPRRESSRWSIAARLRCDDVAQARLAARSDARWKRGGQSYE